MSSLVDQYFPGGIQPARPTKPTRLVSFDEFLQQKTSGQPLIAEEFNAARDEYAETYAPLFVKSKIGDRPKRGVTEYDTLAGEAQEEFRQAIERVVPKRNPDGFLDSAGNLARAAGSGFLSAVAAPITFFSSPENSIAKGLNDTSDSLRQGMTQDELTKQKRVAQQRKLAEQTGSVLNEIGTYIKTIRPNDIASAVGSVAADLPLALATGGAGAVAGRALRVAGAGANAATAGRLAGAGAYGAASGVGAIEGGVYEAVEKEAITQGKTPEQAAAMARQAYENIPAEQKFIAAGLGGLGSITGVESPLLASNIINRASRGAINNAVRGALAEGGQEFVQGAQERRERNRAMIDQKLSSAGINTGIFGEGAAGAVLGFGLGAGFNARSDSMPSITDLQNADPIQGKLAPARKSQIGKIVMGEGVDALIADTSATGDRALARDVAIKIKEATNANTANAGSNTAPQNDTEPTLDIAGAAANLDADEASIFAQADAAESTAEPAGQAQPSASAQATSAELSESGISESIRDATNQTIASQPAIEPTNGATEQDQRSAAEPNANIGDRQAENRGAEAQGYGEIAKFIPTETGNKPSTEAPIRAIADIQSVGQPVTIDTAGEWAIEHEKAYSEFIKATGATDRADKDNFIEGTIRNILATAKQNGLTLDQDSQAIADARISELDAQPDLMQKPRSQLGDRTGDDGKVRTEAQYRADQAALEKLEKTTMESMVGDIVEYEGDAGILTKNDVGYFVAGNLVESGLSGKSPAMLGIKPVNQKRAQAIQSGMEMDAMAGKVTIAELPETDLDMEAAILVEEMESLFGVDGANAMIDAALKELGGGGNFKQQIEAIQNEFTRRLEEATSSEQTATDDQIIGQREGAGNASENEAATKQKVKAPVLQNRNRSNPSSIIQMQNIAKAPDYGRLGFSRDFANGAPVVAGGEIAFDRKGKSDFATASDGRRIPVQYAVIEASVVLASNRADGTPVPMYSTAINRTRAIAGNGRVAGLQKAYFLKNAAQYKQDLANDDLHGIAPDVILSMADPILVRVMPESKITDDIGDVSNTQSNLTLSAVEQAKNDSQRIDLESLQFSESGDVTPETVRRFVIAMPQTEQGGLLDSNGQPTRQAIDRLNAAVFATAYQNDALIRLYAQAQDPEARLILSAIAQVAPKMARLEGAGALDIRTIVTDAAEIAVNARRDGKELRLVAKQVDINADPNVGVVLKLFADNPRSAQPVVEALSRAADFAYAEAIKPTNDMFGEVPKAKRQDVVNQIGEDNAKTESVENPTGSATSEKDTPRNTPAPNGQSAPRKNQAEQPLKAQTSAELKAKAEREANAAELDQRNQIRKESQQGDSTFMQGFSGDARVDTTGNLFSRSNNSTPTGNTPTLIRESFKARFGKDAKVKSNAEPFAVALQNTRSRLTAAYNKVVYRNAKKVESYDSLRKELNAIVEKGGAEARLISNMLEAFDAGIENLNAREKTNAPKPSPQTVRDLVEQKRLVYHVSPLPKFDGTKKSTLDAVADLYNMLSDKSEVENISTEEFDSLKSQMRSLDKLEKAIKQGKRAFGDVSGIDADSFYASTQPDYWKSMQEDELGIEYDNGGIYAVVTKQPVNETFVPSGMGQQAPEAEVKSNNVEQIIGPFATTKEANVAVSNWLQSNPDITQSQTTATTPTGNTPTLIRESFKARFGKDANGLRFSLSSSAKTSPENLIVTHNLTEANVGFAMRVGGLAVPSLAITKKDQAIAGFGEITLIGNKNIVDPKGYARTKVFGADIYSPRYPNITYILSPSSLKRLNESLEKYRGDDRLIYGSEISTPRDLMQVDAFKRYAESRNPNKDSDIEVLALAMLQEVGSDEKLFQGFTYSGNRKYKAHTLDNVIKELKKNLRGGESYNYGLGSVRSKYTPQFKSIAQIKANASRLVTNEQFESIKKEMDDELIAVADELKEFHPAGERFGFLEKITSVLADMASMSASKALKENGFNDVPPENLRGLIDLASKLRNMPTEYFEAKILRGVDIAEFVAAVVPESTNAETIKTLESRGLKIFKYTDAASRRQAIQDAAEKSNAVFSLSATSTNTGNTATAIKSAIDSYFGKGANEKLKQVFVVEGAKDVPEGALKSDDNAQAFYNPKTGDIYLIADKIKQGEEIAVFYHEVGHKRLQQAIGTVGMRQLRKGVDAWKDAPEGSNERIVWEAADARALNAATSTEKTFGNYDENLALGDDGNYRYQFQPNENGGQTIGNTFRVEKMPDGMWAQYMSTDGKPERLTRVRDLLNDVLPSNEAVGRGWAIPVKSFQSKDAIAQRNTKDTSITNNQDVYDAEIITYAIEEAAKLGIEPKATAPVGTVAKWLASVKAAFSKAVAKLFKGDAPNLTTSDLLDIAKGAAGLELENAPTNVDSKDSDYLAAVERGDMDAAQRIEDIRFSLTTSLDEKIALAKTGKAPDKEGRFQDLMDTTATRFVDSTRPLDVWTRTLPDQGVAARLIRDKNLAAGVEGDFNKRVMDKYGKPISAAVRAIAAASGKDGKPKYTFAQAIEVAGDWLAATYAPIANQNLLRKDLVAIQDATEAAKLDPSPANKAAITRAKDAYLKRKAAIELKQDIDPTKTPHGWGVAGGYNNQTAKLMTDTIEKSIDKTLLDEVARHVYAMNAFKLQTDVSIGKVTPAIAATFDQSGKYVPLTGDPRTDESGTDLFGTGSLNQSKDKKMAGRTGSLSQNGIDASFEQVGKTARYLGWNDFKDQLHNGYESMIAEYMQQGMTNQEAQQRLREDTGLSRSPETMQRPSDNVIIYRKNGESWVYDLGNDAASEGLRSANLEPVPTGLKYIAAATRTLARLVTQFMPGFATINTIRDVWEKSENVRTRVLKEYPNLDMNAVSRSMLGNAANFPARLKNISAVIAQDTPLEGKLKRDPSNAEQNAVAEFLRLGGASTWGDFLSSDSADLADKLKSITGLPNKSMQVLETWNNSFELISSFSLYQALTSQGVDNKTAAETALELMNFRKGGTMMKPIKALYMFAQPIATGANQLIKTMSTKRGQARYAAYVTAGVMLYAMLRSGEDDEERGINKMDERSSFMLERNIVIPIGDTDIKIPIGFGLPQLAWGHAVNLVKMTLGKQTALETAGEVLKGGLKTMSPVSPSETAIAKNPGTFAVQSILPTLLRPVGNVAMDVNAFGSPLTKTFKSQDKAKALQGKQTTPEEYKQIALWLSQNGIDVYPEQVRELWRGYFIGALNEVTKAAIENPAKAAQGKPTVSQFIDRWAAAQDDDALTDRLYYRRRAELDEVKRLSTVKKDLTPKEKAMVKLQEEVKKEESRASGIMGAATRAANKTGNKTLLESAKQRADDQRDKAKDILMKRWKAIEGMQ